MGGRGEMLFFLNSNIDNVGPCRLVVTCRLSVFNHFFFCGTWETEYVMSVQNHFERERVSLFGGISQTF